MEDSKVGDAVNASVQMHVSGPSINANVEQSEHMQMDKIKDVELHLFEIKEILIHKLNTSIESLTSLVVNLTSSVEGLAYRIQNIERNCNIVVDKVVLSDHVKDEPALQKAQTPFVMQPLHAMQAAVTPTWTPPLRGTSTVAYNNKANAKTKEPFQTDFMPFVDLISDEDDGRIKSVTQHQAQPQAGQLVTKSALTTKHRPKSQGSKSAMIKPVVRRLLPDSKGKPTKMPKLEPHVEPTTNQQPKLGSRTMTTRIGTTPLVTQQTQKYKPRGVTTPKILKTNFPITPNMGLTQEHVQVLAYVFHPDRDPGEFIFKVGDIVGTRNDFQCLSPGRIVDEHIMKFMATKATWWQQHLEEQTTWSLPPSFARDVRARTSIQNLIDTYATFWMPPFTQLKYVYVPIEEVGGHWYLMIISIQDRLIYHVDCYYEPENVVHRHGNIRNLSEVVSEIVMSSNYPENYLDGVFDPGNWEIIELGPFIDYYCNYSSIWVIHWMDMEWTFNGNQLQLVDHDSVRARVSMGLLLGDHNEFKATLELNAELTWKSSAFTATR